MNLNAPRWLESASRLIDRGYVLLLDYGEPAALLYGERHPRGTLRCYRQHTMNEEPLRHVGLQDITAHVDLSAVTRAGESSELTLLGASHQDSLLDRLGLPALRDRIERNVSSRGEQRAHREAVNVSGVDPGQERLCQIGRGLRTETAPHERPDGLVISIPAWRHEEFGPHPQLAGPGKELRPDERRYFSGDAEDRCRRQRGRQRPER